jgi:hypothetical protein
MSWVLTVCTWLNEQEASIALRNSIWVYPIIESVHVLSLCLFLGFTFILDLRLLNHLFRGVPVSHMTSRLLPWTFVGFALMVVSGSLLFYGDPVRFYGNVFFRAKVILLVLAGLNAWLFHATVYRRLDEWDRLPVSPLLAKLAGIFSLVLWAGVVAAGRMIAYNWFK